jgi:hypothetical protein
MPATISRRPPDDGDSFKRPIQFGAILEKIRRGGSNALNNNERVIVVEIFRACAMTNDKRVTKLRDEISQAHLEFCFRLPPKRTKDDP